MPAIAVIGAQWGDEGKGKIVDLLAEKALKRTESPPDIIYDTGDMGKEPIIWLFAKDPEELLKKMEMMQSWKIN